MPGATHTIGSISSIFINSSGDSCMWAGGVGSSTLPGTLPPSPPSPLPPPPAASGCRANWCTLGLLSGRDPGGKSGIGPLESLPVATETTLATLANGSLPSPPLENRSFRSADRRMETTKPPPLPFCCCAVGSLAVASPALSHHCRF